MSDHNEQQEIDSIVVKSISPILIPQPLLGEITGRLSWWDKLINILKREKQDDKSK